MITDSLPPKQSTHRQSIQRLCLLSKAAVLFLITTLFVTACKKKEEEAPEVSVTVQAEHPSTGPISEEIAADAVLAPLAQAALASRLSAPIRAEYVQRGASVHRGQLLITLEDGDLQGSALENKGSLTAAEAAFATATNATIPEEVQKAELEVAQTKANLDVASRTSTDRKRLFDQGALPGRDADLAAALTIQAQAAYDTAVKHLSSVQKTTREADARAAEGQLTSAKGKLMSAEAQVGYASLRSPIDGVVTDRPFFPGETAAAGTALLTVMDTTSLLAKLHIAQASAQQLKLGGTAEITVPGLADPVDGTISLISPALDPGSTTVEVWLKLANPKSRFKVGTAVHAVIHGRTIQKAVQVPVTALLPAQDGSNTVMIVGADNVAHLKPVTVGIRTEKQVQILSGVAPSDNVVTNGSYGLDDGTKVAIGDAKPEAGAKD